MEENNVILFKNSSEKNTDTLTELLKTGAQQLIKQAVEAEVQELLHQYSEVTIQGKKAIVRNGYLPDRTIQTGLGEVPVQIPKVRDKSKQGIKFNSSLIPPYLKRTKSIEELLPVLYLKGISTGDFQEALEALLGKEAKGLSPGTISRLKSEWKEEHQSWSKRSLKNKYYVYIWADGVYFNVRGDNDRECILVITGVDAQGKKELIAIEDGYRESTDSWTEVLQDLRYRGLEKAPKLATADGSLGFWKALSKVYPTTKHQRCCVHKTANILSKVPKSVQPKIKSALHEIWMSESRKEACKALEKTLFRFQDKYPKAMNCLKKDQESILAFYDFPAIHWQHIRTSNPIESTFSTIRLRTDKMRSAVSRESILSMVFKLTQSAEKSWRKLKGL